MATIHEGHGKRNGKMPEDRMAIFRCDGIMRQQSADRSSARHPVRLRTA